MQTTGDHANLIATEAITSRFVMQQPFCNQFHAATASCIMLPLTAQTEELKNYHETLQAQASQIFLKRITSLYELF